MTAEEKIAEFLSLKLQLEHNTCYLKKTIEAYESGEFSEFSVSSRKMKVNINSDLMLVASRAQLELDVKNLALVNKKLGEILEIIGAE